MTKAELALRKVEALRRKCDEAAASNAPWSLGNLRTYQNLMVKALGEYYEALNT